MLICPHCTQRGIGKWDFLAGKLYGVTPCRICGAVLEQRSIGNGWLPMLPLVLVAIPPWLVHEFSLSASQRRVFYVLLLVAVALAAAAPIFSAWVERHMVQWTILKRGTSPEGKRSTG